MGYKISIKASEDIEEIWLYTFENWSQEQADRYINLIIEEIECVAANPSAGKDLSYIRKYYRYTKVKSHLILYKKHEKENDIEIIRVLHQRMDIKSRLND